MVIGTRMMMIVASEVVRACSCFRSISQSRVINTFRLAQLAATTATGTRMAVLYTV